MSSAHEFRRGNRRLLHLEDDRRTRCGSSVLETNYVTAEAGDDHLSLDVTKLARRSDDIGDKLLKRNWLKLIKRPCEHRDRELRRRVNPPLFFESCRLSW